MNLFHFVILVCYVSSSLGNPSNHGLGRYRRQVDFVGNTQALVQEFIQNLENAAQDAIDATKKFNEGLQEQAKLFTEKIIDDLKVLRDRINTAINGFSERFVDAGAAVQACVENFRKEVDVVFNETVETSQDCANARIKEIGEMIENLNIYSSNATVFAKNAMEELRDCTNNSGFLVTGSCIGKVAIKTEFQGTVFLTQSGLMISRINLALATLPAALEVCAGTRVVTAGINSAKFLVEIGACSASSVYTSLVRSDLSY